MLDSRINQASGLQRVVLQATPRVIAIASHCDRRHELPVLWEVCSAIGNMGYSLAVLDSSISESTTQPGLEQMLQQGLEPRDAGDPESPWTIIAAANGLRRLQDLKAQPPSALRQLGYVMRNLGVVILYAPAETVGNLLADTGLEPLLVLPPVRAAVLTGYQALKHMFLHSRLNPTIAGLEQHGWPGEPATGTASVLALQSCSLSFLGFRPDAMVIASQNPSGSGMTNNAERLALRLLESAVHLPGCRDANQPAPIGSWQAFARGH